MEWTKKREKKPCIASQEVKNVICVSLFMVKPYTFSRLVLSPCCWELCTACSGVAMLHCLLNQQFPHSQAPFSSTSWHNMPGPVLMTSSLLSLSLWTKPLGKEVSRTAAHACPLVPLRHTELSPVRRPCSVALQQQIILDDFILITFSLIFFYLHGDMPQWLRNIPQVGAHMPLWADAGTQEHTHWHFERKLITITTTLK